VFELLLFGGVALLGLAVLIAAFTALAVVFRALVWVVILPVKLLVGLVVGLIVFPILALVSGVGMLIGLVVFGALVAVPLLPLLLLGLLVWVVVKLASPVPA
jgi:hypothetical protein